MNMPVVSSDVARIFNQLADLLEIRSANPFRVRAFKKSVSAGSASSRRRRDTFVHPELRVAR
jgi:DNA polymerase/3'-5' exonuclease PolX